MCSNNSFRYFGADQNTLICNSAPPVINEQDTRQNSTCRRPQAF